MSQDSDSDSPLSRVLRACRAHESHDGSASEAVVSDADGAADAGVAADAGGAGGAGGAGLRPRRRIWRNRRDANAARKAEALTECVKAVSSRLGRVVALLVKRLLVVFAKLGVSLPNCFWSFRLAPTAMSCCRSRSSKRTRLLYLAV